MWRKTCVVLVWILGCYFTSGQDCGVKPPQAPWDEEAVSLVTGGREAVPGNWPWQVSLQFNDTGYYHTCGAIAFDDWWVLTAAHCVEGRQIGLNDSRREDPSYFKVIFGLFNQSETETATTQHVDIDLIIRHERWLPDPYKGFPNDIALVRLVEPADFTLPHVEKACIPTQNDMNFTGEECWITGWGKTNWTDDWIPETLQEGLVASISNEYCNEVHFGFIRDTHICAGTGMPNACSGDSGGPMSCYKDGTWYAAGITSWGIVTCQNLPAVYTRISMFWEWIVTNMLANPPPGLTWTHSVQ